jgi:hypothetical protein
MPSLLYAQNITAQGYGRALTSSGATAPTGLTVILLIEAPCLFIHGFRNSLSYMINGELLCQALTMAPKSGWKAALIKISKHFL